MSPAILIIERDYPEDLPFYRDAIHAEFPDLPVAIAANKAEALAQVAGVTAIMAKDQHVPAELIPLLPQLEWVQALTTGVDNLMAMSVPASVTITSARGVHRPQMSELAMLFMLALARDFPRMLNNQQQAHWQRWPQPLLIHKRIGIVGIGTISEALATRCKAFGMHVTGISDSRQDAPDFDRVAPRSELTTIAAQVDFLVVLAPYTPQTHHMINAEVLAALPRSAFLINIARGKVVDEAALINALQNGTIAGAGLDVFDKEPLSTDSPLWTMPNVIITPHIGGLGDHYAQQLLPLMLTNLRRYLAGESSKMENRVSR
jgi:phosphoglycerate dehydrogenase-like enzyme